MLLSSREPIWGLEICRQLGLKPGTVYPILRRLELAGWVNAGWDVEDSERAGMPRKLYKLTSLGEKEVAKYLEESAHLGLGKQLRIAE